MAYLRDQMLFDDSLHYNWSDAEHTGILRAEVLDRSNGNQVLQFINQFATEQGISELGELREIEFLIRYGTPTAVQTIPEVKDLIKSKLESQKVLAD